MIFIQLIWYISLPPKSVSNQNHLKFAAKNCPTQLIQRIKVILTDVFIGRYSRFFRCKPFFGRLLMLLFEKMLFMCRLVYFLLDTKKRKLTFVFLVRIRAVSNSKWSLLQHKENIFKKSYFYYLIKTFCIDFCLHTFFLHRKMS